MSNKRTSTVRISFKHNEKNIESHIRSKGDMSVYIKDLVRKDMENEKSK